MYALCLTVCVYMHDRVTCKGRRPSACCSVGLALAASSEMDYYLTCYTNYNYPTHKILPETKLARSRSNSHCSLTALLPTCVSLQGFRS